MPPTDTLTLTSAALIGLAAGMSADVQANTSGFADGGLEYVADGARRVALNQLRMAADYRSDDASSSGVAVYDRPPQPSEPTGAVQVETLLDGYDVSGQSSGIPPGSTVTTGQGSTVTLTQDDGTTVQQRENTRVTIEPPVIKSDGVQTNSYHLFQGTVQIHHPHDPKHLTVVCTPIACMTTKGTSFSSSYNQDGTNGQVNVVVTEGTVEVKDREGSTYDVTAGNDKTIRDRVFRSSWVQPAANALVYVDQANNLQWTAYEGAQSYLMEYLFPNPSYSQANPHEPEFIHQTIRFTPDMYTLKDGYVKTTMPVPNVLSLGDADIRLFPVDAQGTVLTTAFGSDAIRVFFHDKTHNVGRYDASKGILYIDDVIALGAHYQVQLTDASGAFSNFQLSYATPIANSTRQDPGTYDSSTNLVLLPRVTMVDGVYRIKLTHLGNWQFRLVEKVRL